LAAGCVPDLHGPVLAGGGEPVAVGAERQAPDTPLVAVQREERSSLGQVPDTYVAVLAGGEPFAVGAERQAVGATIVHRTGVGGQREDLRARGCVPDLDLAGQAPAVAVLPRAGGSEPPAVGAEGGLLDRNHVAAQTMKLLPRPAIPEAHGPVEARG